MAALEEAFIRAASLFKILELNAHQKRAIQGKECGSVFSSRLWGGALRDDTKNGCVADYGVICFAKIQTCP